LLQINTAVVGTTPEVDDFNHYTPLNKPASILNFFQSFNDDGLSSPCVAPLRVFFTIQSPHLEATFIKRPSTSADTLFS
jgi:hypothetical protein